MCSIFATCSTVYACSGFSPPSIWRTASCSSRWHFRRPFLVPVNVVYRRSRSAQVDPEQSPDHDGDQAWRHVAHLHVARFLTDGDDHDCEQYEDERKNGEDDQDQHGKHQLSTPLLMI